MNNSNWINEDRKLEYQLEQWREQVAADHEAYERLEDDVKCFLESCIEKNIEPCAYDFMKEYGYGEGAEEEVDRMMERCGES